MKSLWNNFKVAFAMFSKIPMPRADWTKENMKYSERVPCRSICSDHCSRVFCNMVRGI